MARFTEANGMIDDERIILTDDERIRVEVYERNRSTRYMLDKRGIRDLYSFMKLLKDQWSTHIGRIISHFDPWPGYRVSYFKNCPGDHEALNPYTGDFCGFLSKVNEILIWRQVDPDQEERADLEQGETARGADPVFSIEFVPDGVLSP